MGQGVDIGGGRGARALGAMLAAASLAACASPHLSPEPVRPTAGGNLPGTMRPYQVHGVWYTPHEDPHYIAEGMASWYGAQFHNHTTSDGEIFDMDVASAAHKTLPLPSLVEVTNLDNGRKIKVRLNDRGPFVGSRLIDLSAEGAKELGYYQHGLAHVRVRYLGPAPPAHGDAGLRMARAEAVATPAPPPPEPAPPAVLAPDPIAVSPAPVTEAATRPWRIQAGAFSSLDNARHAAEALSGAGQATVEPVSRAGAPLYRVTVTCRPGDDPRSVRDSVAAAGFPGARVMAPS